MRFHMGISFRLKSLKKFLFPFLVGLLAYFGISSFNIMQVHAYSSTTTFYRFQYDEIDFDDIQTNGDYSFKDILDITQIPSEYYYVDSYIKRTYNSSLNVDSYNVVINLFPKSSFNSFNVAIYGNLYNNNYYINYQTPSNFSHVVLWNNTLNQNLSQEQFELLYSKFYSCLTENVCDSNYFATTTDRVSFRIDNFGSISNNDSYTINFKDYLFDSTQSERFIPYYTNMDSVLRTTPGTTTTSQFYKKISINGVGVSANEYFKHYCDFYECSIQDETITYNDVNTKFQSLYSILDINNLNGTLFNIYYKVPNADLYTEKIDRFVNLFYGRIDHGTYYSYENINCSITIDNNNDISNNVIDYTLHNVNCSNVDLTRYDKILFYHSIRFQDDNIDKSILSLNIGSNLDYKYGVYKGLIYDKLDIPNNYNYIFSSSSISWVAMYFSSNDSRVSYDLFSNEPNYTNTLSNKSLLSCSIDTGNFVNEIGLCFFKFGMYVYNYNLIIFNNNTNMQDSYIDVYYSDDSIIASYGYTGDTFYYYDNTGTLVNDALSFDYEEQFYDNDYDSINSIFDDINNYFNGINEDLGKLHIIINNIYVSIPISYRYPLNIFYIIGLIYILYREIKR